MSFTPTSNALGEERGEGSLTELFSIALSEVIDIYLAGFLKRSKIYIILKGFFHPKIY